MWLRYYKLLCAAANIDNISFYNYYFKIVYKNKKDIDKKRQNLYNKNDVSKNSTEWR